MSKEKCYNVISLGAGKQSTAMLIQALEGRFSVIPDAAVFCDVGSEPSFVYDHIAWLQNYCLEKFSFEITVIAAGDLGNSVLNYAAGNSDRTSSPPFFLSQGGLIRRQCTLNFKLRPIRRFCQKTRIGRKVIMWLGISLDEMQRMSISSLNYIEHYYPLIESRQSLSDIHHYYSSSKLPEPGKSACFFCPFHSDLYWKVLQSDYPADFEKACYFDDSIRNFPKLHSKAFLHRSLTPLRSIDFNAQKSLFPELIDECYGICGI
jgi:hypothetical protein